MVNYTHIECGPNGQIRVICNEYSNSATIFPEPVVTTGPGAMPKMLSSKVFVDSERVIPLEIYDHRGHHSSNVPENLFKEGKSYRGPSSYSHDKEI